MAGAAIVRLYLSAAVLLNHFGPSLSAFGRAISASCLNPMSEIRTL